MGSIQSTLGGIYYLFFFSPGTADKELVSLIVPAIGFVFGFFFDYNYYYYYYSY